MDLEEFRNFEASCCCKRCPQCWTKSLVNYCYKTKDYSEFRKNIFEGYQGIPMFEHFQVHNIVGEMPWRIRNRIKDIINSDFEPLSSFEESLWILYNEKESNPIPRNSYTFSLRWVALDEETTSIMVLEGGGGGLVYAFMATKHCSFSLKTLSAHAVISQISGKWKLQSLVAAKLLPSSLADYLLNIH